MATTLQAESFSEVNIVERTLLDDVYSSGTILTVASTQGFSAGQTIYVGTPSREGCEKGVIQAVSSATELSLASALGLPHSRFESVVAVLGDSIHIYRSANVDGSVPVDDDFSVIATRSIDPDQQTTYYTDPSGSSSFWYKMTYYNATTSDETSLNAAPAVRGDDFGHYASLSQIRREAGFEKAYNLSDTVIDQQRRAAESEINSTLAANYTTPFSPVPASIRTLTIQLAAGLLLGQAYGEGSAASTAKLKAVRAQLAAMASRNGTVTDDSGNSLVSSGAISSYPDSSPEEGGPPRAFTADMRF